MDEPRQYSLVRVKRAWLEKVPPFDDLKMVYVFLGRLVNMPDCCIVIEHRTGKIWSGYHVERFEEIPEDELL
jgi:hypothetical protein